MSGANGANDGDAGGGDANDGANDGGAGGGDANDGGAGGGDAGFAVLRILTDGGYLHPRETMAVSKTCTYMRRWAWNGLVTRYAAGTGLGFGFGTGTGLGFDARAPVTRGGAYGEVSRTDSKRRYTLDDTDLARLGRAFVTRYIKTYSVTATYYRAIDVFWLACAKYGGPRGIVNRRKMNRRKTRT